jgi:protoporphyrin/coproporphyrin ferrochelatase
MKSMRNKDNLKNVAVLIQLGTPETLTRKSVGNFIRSFLLDPRVIEMPSLFRHLLVRLIIVPFRAKKSLGRYQQIWDPVQGSPLLHHSRELTNKLAAKEIPGLEIRLAFQHGTPHLKTVLEDLQQQGVRNIILVPMYPQPAPSTTGSVYAAVQKELVGWPVQPEIRWISPLWDLPGYIDLLINKISRHHPAKYDRILFSYHGLPLKQSVSGYSAACESMTQQIARKLGLPVQSYRLAYQSRLGKGWVGPQSTEVMDAFLSEGVRSLLVVAPSFTADCLETDWEIGIDFRHRFLSGGGSTFEWVRSLNADDNWAEWLGGLISRETRMGE